MKFWKRKLTVVASLLIIAGVVFLPDQAQEGQQTNQGKTVQIKKIATERSSKGDHETNQLIEGKAEIKASKTIEIPTQHPRWPEAVVQKYRTSPSSDPSISIREWILDTGRRDLPVKVVEKVTFEGEPNEAIVSYLEMAANRVLVFSSENVSLLETQFPDAELKPLADGVMILTASSFDLDTVQRLMADAETSEAVVFAEPDYVVRPTVIPNDPRFSSQWGLNNTRSSGADIDAPEAWDLRNNAGSRIIAIIDSGLRTTHEDIRSNLWSNPSESLDGVDNDRNGIIDDINGLNAVSNNGNVTDNDGHGTHVAGIAGAQGNNGLGISGVAWDVQIMPIKFLESGSGSTSDAIQAIDYAISKGADVINASWGGPGQSAGLAQAISRARSAGIPFIAAAGNESANNDTTSSFPANFTFDNIVSVGSSTSSDTRSSFSNFGSTSVDVFAPGDGIVSTWNTSDGAYQSLSGTSMATPMVTGMIALIAAQFPGESYSDWIQRIIAGVDRPSALQGLSVSGGRANLNTSLRASNADSAPVITSGLNDRQVAIGGTLNLSVTATGTQPLSYSWSRDNLAIPGQNGPNLTLNNLQIGDSGTYQVLVSNTAGVATSSAEVLVTDEVISIAAAFDSPNQDFLVSGNAPWEQHQNSSVIGNESLKSGLITHNQISIIQTEINGPGTLCFWWRVSSEQFFDFLSCSVNGVLHGQISGETSWQRVCIDLGSGANTVRWGYSKDFSEQNGQDAGFLDGFEFINALDSLPQIVRQPISQVVSTGASTSFTVVAESPETPTYQWLKDGALIFSGGNVSGANTDTLRVGSVSAADGGLYSVQISNFAGTRTSSLVQLTVNDALEPQILTHPQGATIGVSAELTLSVQVDGSAPFEYQWQKDGTNISGANQKDLVITDAVIEDTGDYRVIVSNSAGSATSEVAEILVIEVSILPVFLKHPPSAFLRAGDELNLSVAVGGATPRTIQWFKDDTELAGETAETLTITSTTIDNSGTYWAEVTNDFGSAKSRVATVAVLSRSDAFIAAINGEGSGITLENTEGPGWFPQSNVTDTDSLTMQSGAIGPLQSSTLTSYAIGPGTLFFRWKVSSQPDNDFLQFRVNETTIFGISGEHEWETRSFELQEGINKLDWVYVKSAIDDSGEDAGFLDRIFLSDGAEPLRAIDYFPGSADAGNGWIFNPAFEFIFGDNFRWVYHPEHQWWYLFGVGGESTWMFDLGLGWIHTHPNVYPSVFSAREDAWLFYDTGTATPRIFINIDTQEQVDAGF